MTPRSMHALNSVVNEDMRYERWTFGFLLWVLFSLATIELHFGHSLWETKRQSSSSHDMENNKETNPTGNYRHQSRVLHRGGEEGGAETRRAHRACAKDTAIPVTWWADGWSHDYMHTKSYKSQVQHSFFKWHASGLCVVPLWPAGLCFIWRPTEALGEPAWEQLWSM